MSSSVDVLTLLQTGRGTPGGFLNPGRIANMPNRNSDGYTVMPCITSSGGGSAYDGNAVKNSVVEKGEKASKPGGLGEMANNGTEDAVDQIVDQVSKAVLEPLAGDLKKSMGYPPAPPPPPAPAPPYKSWK